MRKNHLLWAAVSALLFLASFLPPLRQSGTAALAFLPLFILTFDSSSPGRRLFWTTLVNGLLYYGILLSWLLNYDVGLYFVVLVMMSPVFSIYFLALRGLTRRSGHSLVKALAAGFLWIALHQIYRLTPIGSVGFETPFYGSLSLYQAASVSGFIGVAGLVMSLNAALALGFRERAWKALAVPFFFLTLVTCVYFWGKNTGATAPSRGIKVALLQHNLPEDMEWREENPGLIRLQYQRLVEEAGRENPDLIVLPLYTFPDSLLDGLEPFLSDLALRSRSHLVLATHLPVVPADETSVVPNTFKAILEEMGETDFANTALLFSPAGEKVGEYQAVRARPFQDLLEEAVEHTRKDYETLPSPFGPLGILLCYEDVLPEVAQRAVTEGAEILLALSNTGEFTSTHLPDYHLVQDQLRAIETHRWLLRVTPNGPSAVINPRGKIIQKSDAGTEEILTAEAGVEQSQTLFQRYPFWLQALAWIFVAGLAGGNLIFRRRENSGGKF